MITALFLLKAFVGAGVLYAASCAADRLHRKYNKQHTALPACRAACRYVASLNGVSITTGDCAVAAMLRRMGYEIHTETTAAL